MKRFFVAALVAALAVYGALPATALVTEGDEAPELSFHFDEETGLLTFAYGVGVDCSEGAVSEGADQTEGLAAGADEPPAIGECHTIDATGPNGQINHGSAVSAVVRALKAYDLDVPRGHIVREIAKSTVGKDKVDGSDSDDSEDSELNDKSEKSNNGQGKAGKSNNGKAKGKNK